MHSETKFAKIVHDETLKSGPVVSHGLYNVCIYIFVSQGLERLSTNICINMYLKSRGINVKTFLVHV